MPELVRITDVAPRDGLQNEPGRIPTPDKARLVNALARTGVDEVEVTSFVSPKWIPQLGDAEELCRLIAPDKPRGVLYSALVPNERGMDALLAANSACGARVIDKAAVFTAASETFCRRNINAGFAESLGRFAPVIEAARGGSVPVRGYLSCVIACPFEGPIAPGDVAERAVALCHTGIDELDLGDTIGSATPDTLAAMLDAVRDALGRAGLEMPLTLHLHDTNGAASACAARALELGVRSFDASIAGLGGCPYASTPTARAPGNINTLDLVRVIDAGGFVTRTNSDALADASAIASELVAGTRAGGSA